MNNTMAYAVEADDLVKTYPGGVTALDGLSISALSNTVPPWIRTVASFNPLNWSLDSARGAPAAHPDRTAVAVHGGWS
jgi:hypothetical protein